MPDVSLFGITKRAIFQLNKRRKSYVQMEHIADAVEGFLNASTPANIVASFRKGGISLALDDNQRIITKVTAETGIFGRSSNFQSCESCT
jgi:hypothetical protein